ncbi:flagellar biosynthesis protein FlhF [Alicyclobacillus contaminans]|uniref:flagellar biosynthesis protein FlhF n=1 Tax=Alicyclobacillus contaminans TaxID=392016 RepID=UPI0003FB288F|nr:flagellar biosynthesis protein FlhF [Alicyclobacillus contaminans]
MMIRRYVVREMPDAVIQIRRELGKDAVILSSKRITIKKWLGLWRTKRIEVLAAAGDDVPVRIAGPREWSQMKAGRAAAPVRPAGENDAAQAAAGTGADTSAGEPSGGVSHPTSTPLDDVRAQIEEMKQMLRTMVGGPSSPMRPPLMQQLLRQGVSEERIVRWLRADDPSEAEGAHEAFLKRVMTELAEVEARPIEPTSRVVALVGPTGVGKSTTIAKLASLHVLAGKRRIGLLTTDTFRIAAVDQMRTYANILNIPLEVVYHEDEAQAAMRRLSNCDLVLMDTAGRNFRMDRHVEEVRGLLEAVGADETILVLSAASKGEDMEAVTAAFADLPIDKFLFTKLDETSTYGAILNLLDAYRKPLSYVTTGQNVPDDIEVASFENLLRLIVGGAS